MTTIDKLLIQGIRSFSPQNRNIIEFYQPLTLIVGPNGAGKTTIIECLKYCTTGNMPPGSKSGQAFVHDPKVAGEREVKAQIKLRFRNVNGKPIVCTRSLQCTQRASNKVCKTLESALQTYNSANEKVSQSFRCADLDREIPELIGVSKPILENVIFCHQEESNWPLSEGSTLKKKFDDIFAATRYTKALEAIKKHRKEQAQSIKELKLKLENLQNQKDNAHKIRRELESKQGFQENAEGQLKELQSQIEELEKAATELKRKTNTINALMNEISNLKAVQEQMINERNKTYKELKEEFEESDEELLKLATDFKKDFAEKEKSTKELEEKLNTSIKNKQKHEELLLKLREQSTDLKGSIERHKGIASERDKEIVSFAQRYGITGYDEGPFSQEQVGSFLQQSNLALQNLKQQIEALKGSWTAQNKELTSAIEKTHSEMSSFSAQIKQKTSLLEENKRKLSRMTAEMKEKQNMYSKLSQIEASVEKQERELSEMRGAFNVEEINLLIEQIRNEKKLVDGEIVALSNQMKALSLQASTRARLNVKKADAQKKEEAYKASYAQKKADFEALCGDVPLEKLKGELTLLLNKKKREVTTARNKLQELKMSGSSLIGEQKSLQNQLKQLEQQLEEKSNALKQLEVINRPLPEIIEEIEKKIQSIKNDMAMTESAERMFQNFIDLAQENQECPLCERGMCGSPLKEFVAKLQDKLAKVPESLKANEIELAEREELYQQLCDLRPVWQDHVRLQEQEIPSAKKRLEAINEKKSGLDVEIEQLQETLTGLQQSEQNMVALSGELDGILRTYNEYVALSKEVSAEQRKLSLSSSDTRSLEDVEKEYSEKQKKSEELRLRLDALTKESGDKQGQILRQEAALNKLKAQLVETQGASTALLGIQKNFDEISSANEALEIGIKEAEANLVQQTQLKVKQTEEREKALKEHEANMELVQAEREKFQKALTGIENLHKQLAGKSVDSLQADLEKLEVKRNEVQSKIEVIAGNIKEGTETLQSLREILASSDLHKRNIDDNIKYRKQKGAILRMEHQIGLKEEQLRSENVESVEFDLAKQNKLIEKKKQELNQMIGKRDIFVKQIKEHVAELKKPMYKNIDEQFRQMLIQVKTSEMANNDLEKYYVALDKALMKYHSVKMAEINKIIRELWQRTYKGQDIDTIEIRSDPETSTGGKTSRSSYNYRVVMLKGDNELDMRGRCSAGQKVLASLIIRLALAETFCLNCGILALDEPTTNLDRLNVESFANSLVSIITSRKQQRNFQLIIITHDEEFVQLLGRSEHADYYWRVSKDTNGHSILERQDIRDLA